MDLAEYRTALMSVPLRMPLYIDEHMSEVKSVDITPGTPIPRASDMDRDRIEHMCMMRNEVDLKIKVVISSKLMGKFLYVIKTKRLASDVSSSTSDLLMSTIRSESSPENKDKGGDKWFPVFTPSVITPSIIPPSGLYTVGHCTVGN